MWAPGLLRRSARSWGVASTIRCAALSLLAPFGGRVGVDSLASPPPYTGAGYSSHRVPPHSSVHSLLASRRTRLSASFESYDTSGNSEEDVSLPDPNELTEGVALNLDWEDATTLLEALRAGGDIKDFGSSTEESLAWSTLEEEDDDFSGSDAELEAQAWEMWATKQGSAPPLPPWTTSTVASVTKSDKSSPKMDPASVAAAVQASGVARVDGVLSAATASALREFVLTELERSTQQTLTQPTEASEQETNHKSPPESDGSFSAVLSPVNRRDATADAAPATTRWDFRLPLNPLVQQALLEVFGPQPPPSTQAEAARGKLAGSTRSEDLGAAVETLCQSKGASGDPDSSSPQNQDQQIEKRRVRPRSSKSRSSNNRSSSGDGGGFGRVPRSEALRKEALDQAGGSTAFRGLDAELWELAAVVSAPGAAPQVVHSDTVVESGRARGSVPSPPCLYTCFVALQDVTSDLGPTRFFPGTHLPQSGAHAALEEQPFELLKSTPAFDAEVPCGTCTLYDGRLLHAGGANSAVPTPPSSQDRRKAPDADYYSMSSMRSNAKTANEEASVAGEGTSNDGYRVLFYATFKVADADASLAANEAAHSIRPDLAGCFTLAHCRGDRPWPATGKTGDSSSGGRGKLSKGLSVRGGGVRWHSSSSSSSSSGSSSSGSSSSSASHRSKIGRASCRERVCLGV